MSSRVVSVKTPKNENPGVPQDFQHLTQNMENELEKRKLDWEQEVSKMQQDFFKMNTGGSSKGRPQLTGKAKTVDVQADSNVPRRGRTGTEIFDISHAKTLYDEQPDGSKLFKLRFDVKGYEPHELTIRAEGQKLLVSARTEEEANTGNKAIKEFNRQVDLPKTVDPDKLVSFLSADGILSIEAPVEFEESSDEEGEEIDVRYINDMGLLAPPGVDPPHYQSVVESNHPGDTGGYNYSYSTRSRSPVAPSGGVTGYRYTSSTMQPEVYVQPGVSYHIESCCSSSGHHDCHHKGGHRKPLKTHVKRTHSPQPHVDYFQQVAPRRTVIEYSSNRSAPSAKPILYKSHNIPENTIEYSSTTMAPSFHTKSSMEYFRYNEPQIATDDEGGKRLKMVVNIGSDYSPEDVQVTITDRKISVQARREQTVQGRTSKREFSREFHSPEELETYTARASLDDDGKLYIGACCRGNKDSDDVMRQVLNDIPSNAQACSLTIND